MPVSTPHPSYDGWFKKADKVRVAVEGEDAVKDRGKDFLPRIGKTKADYDGYKTRAEFTNFTRRIKQALLGTLFRLPVTIKVPTVLDYLKKDASLDGVGLDLMIENTASNVMDQGRHGGLVEFDDKAQRPFVVTYTGANVVNWTTARVYVESRKTNQNVLNMVVLKEETLESKDGDKFNLECVTRYRVLELEDLYGTGKLIYTQRVWVSDGTAGGFKHDGIENVDLFIPTMRNKPLDYIPYIPFNSTHNLPQVEDSMLLDVANTNYKHYMKSADLNHGEHFTCLPVYYMKTQQAVAGINAATRKNINGKNVDPGPDGDGEKRDTKFVLGSAEMLTIPQGNDLDVLEVSGAGLDRVANSLESIEERIAAIGTQLVTQKVEQTATAQGIKSAGEQASLSGLANSLENGWQQILMICAEWVGANPNDVGIQFNRNFIGSQMNQQEVKTMFENLMTGAIDMDTYFYQIQKCEVTPPEWDEAEQRKILEEEMAKRQEHADATREAQVEGMKNPEDDQEAPEKPAQAK